MRSRVVRMGAVVGAGLVAAALVPLLSGAAPGPAWGVLDAACTPDRAAAEASVGMAVVVVEAHWDRYLPAPGTVDPAYVAELGDRVRTCAAAGLRVVLGSGVQYPPSWVRQPAAAALRDQYGAAPVTGQVDAVFGASVRAAQADYLRRLVTGLPAGTVEAVRVGTSAAGELGYPGSSDGGRPGGDSWWAFGAAPQTGVGLAAGQTRSPMPGWVPGRGTWNGRAVTAADALGWFRWYDRALVATVRFQAATLRAAGFTGAVHVPAAGRGVLPADLTAATAARLDGTANRDDSLARGLDYTDQFPALAASVPGVVVDLTSVDDASAGTARALTPPQDTCAADDTRTSVDPAVPVQDWSRLRFARAQAARAGLAAVGENPGPPGAQTGGVPGSDSEAEQLRRAPGYARSCALAAFLFAFEDDLFTDRSGLDLQDYVDAVMR